MAVEVRVQAPVASFPGSPSVPLGGAEAQNRRRIRATSYQGYWGEGAQLLGMIVLVRLQTVQGVSVRGEEGTLAADPAYP